MPTTVVSTSAKGTSFLIIAQLSSRILSFSFNQALLRFVSPMLFGASVQLDLFLITALYFSRETIRIVSQRQVANGQAALNLSYISIALGLTLTPLLAWIYTYLTKPAIPFEVISLSIYSFATIVELFSEPCFLLVQYHLAYAIRAQAESVATLSRCIAVLALSFWSYYHELDLGVLSFAIGQLAYAVTLLGIYYWKCAGFAKSEKIHLWLTPLVSQSSPQHLLRCFPRSACNLAVNMYIQTAVKYALTQGDSLVVASLTPLSEQGAFALASNYGGLLARTIFQPIEDSSRNMFAKLCTYPATEGKNQQEDLARLASVLTIGYKLYGIFALLVWTVGPGSAPLLLQLIAGQKWTDSGAGEVLAVYCYYIPLLALNGISEAFVTAVASEEDLRRQTAFWALYTIAFAGSAYLFTEVLEQGASGIVWANCVNMSLRIYFSCSYIKAFFAGRYQRLSYWEVLPSGASIATAFGIAVIIRGRIPAFDSDYASIIHNLSGTAALMAVLVSCIAVFERRSLKNAYLTLFGSDAAKQAKKDL